MYDEKPINYDYDYEVEKNEGIVTGGLFMFFLIILLVDIPVGILGIILFNQDLSSYQTQKSLFFMFGIFYFCFAIFTCIALHKIPRIAVSVSKIYLVFRLFYLIPVFADNYLYLLHDPVYTDVSLGSNELVKTTLFSLIAPLLYILLFSILWFVYFNKSKRVASTYGHSKKYSP